MKYEDMTVKALKRKVKKYNRFAFITRSLSTIIYLVCGIVLVSYLTTYFKLTNSHIILALVFVTITASIISGFETVMDQIYKEIDLMNLAIKNKKEGSVIDDGEDYTI